MGVVEEVAAVGEDAVAVAAMVVASAIISSRATADSVTSAQDRTKLGLAAVATNKAQILVMEKDAVAVEAAVVEVAVVDAVAVAAMVVASAIISSRATADTVTSARNRTKLGLVAAAVVVVPAT